MGKDLTSETRSLRLPMVGTLGLALLAVVAVALVFNRADSDADRTDRLAAGTGATEPVDGTPGTSDPTDTEPDEPVDDGPTGFYLPGELPEGWTIRFEQITNPWQELCPCETGMWRGPGGETVKSFTSQRQEEPEGPYVFAGDTTVHRDIPGGHLSIEEHQVTADWFDGETSRSIFAEGVDAGVVEQMARGWTGDSPLAAPGGFEPVWSGTTPEIVRRTEFFWVVHDDTTDRSMVVHVEPWMYDEPLDYTTVYPGVEPTVVEGNGLALVQTPGWDEPHFEGLWPGGALMSVASSYGEINHSAVPLTREEMLAVAGGFRPVSAEAWADYIEQQYGPSGTEACRPLLVKPRLADLLVEPDDADAELDVELWELNDDCTVASDEGS